MIKSLKDARIVDGLPRILAKQPWVRALSEAMGVVHEMTMAFADHSQIYTDIDHVAEDVLDTLAVSWKIDWYDTGYNIEQKRRIIKTAIIVRRTMGTAAAVKSQLETIYQGSIVEEWFEYDGQPGTFRIRVNVLKQTEKDKFETMSLAQIEQKILTAKRTSAQLTNVEYTDDNGRAIAYGAVAWAGSNIADGATARKY